MFSSRRRKWGLTLALVAFWVSGKYPALLDPNNLWGKNLGAFPRSPGAAKRDSASLDNRSPQECPGMTFCANARGRIISAILVVIAVTVADVCLAQRSRSSLYRTAPPDLTPCRAVWGTLWG